MESAYKGLVVRNVITAIQQKYSAKRSVNINGTRRIESAYKGIVVKESLQTNPTLPKGGFS